MVNLSCGGGGEWSVFVGTGCVMDDGSGRRWGGGRDRRAAPAIEVWETGGFISRRGGRQAAAAAAVGFSVKDSIDISVLPASVTTTTCSCDAMQAVGFSPPRAATRVSCAPRSPPAFLALTVPCVRACVPASPGQEGSQSNPRAKQRTPASTEN
jgi:hypothetical protein